MAQNLNLTELDLNQALRRCIDADDDTLRVEVGGGTSFEISTSAAEDSMSVKSLLEEDNAAVQSGSSGVLVGPLDVEGYKDLQIMVKNLSAITGSATLTLEVSPVASGDVWIATSVTANATGSADVLSSLSNAIARRARLSVTANTISIGSAQVYLMARG